MQYNTVQYNTVQYSTTQYKTMQYNTIQYNAVQYSKIQYEPLSSGSFFRIKDLVCEVSCSEPVAELHSIPIFNILFSCVFYPRFIRNYDNR